MSKKKPVGRPPKPPGEKRGYRLVVKLTDEERRELAEYALDEPLAVFVRKLVFRALRRRRSRDGT